MTTKYNDTSIPLSIRIATARFIKTLENNKDILTAAGVVVDGINVSTANEMDKSVLETMYLIKKQKKYKFYHIKSEPAEKSTEYEYKDYRSFDIHVFSCLDNDRIIPGLIVFDNTKTAYFLYNDLSYTFEEPLSNKELSRFKLLPFNHQLWENLKKDCKVDPLCKAISTIKSYTLYDINNYKFKEYFEKVLDKFGFVSSTMLLCDEDKFLYAPLINLATEDAEEYDISKSIVYDSGKIKATEGKDGSVVVLHKDDNVMICNRIDSNIMSVCGETYLLNVNKDADISKGKMIYSFDPVKSYSESFAINGYRYDSDDTPISKNLDTTIKHLNNEAKESLTKAGEKYKQIELANYITDAYLDHVNMVTLGEFDNVFNKFIAINLDKKELLTHFATAISNKQKAFMESNKFDKLILLYEIQRKLKNKYRENIK